MGQTGEFDGIGSGSLRISSPDGRDHLVDDWVVARTWDGRFLARCGQYVISAALETPPGRDCPLCMPRPAQPYREPRRPPVRLRRLPATIWMIRVLWSPRVRRATRSLPL